MFTMLKREALHYPTSEAFLLAFFLGYIGQYWRFVRDTKLHHVFHDQAHPQLITGIPRNGPISRYHYLARIDISATTPGVDHIPCDTPMQGWIQLRNRVNVVVAEIVPMGVGLVQSDEYRRQLPQNVEQLQQFYDQAWETNGYRNLRATLDDLSRPARPRGMDG